MRPDWAHEDPDELPERGYLPCAVCRRGPHPRALHAYLTDEQFGAMSATERFNLTERLLAKGAAIVSGSPLVQYVVRPNPPSLDRFQAEVGEWITRNFGKQSDLVLYGGTAEECGEMLRGAVKREQGIRGTREEWDAVIRAEMGDILIKLASIAAQEGWRLSNIIAERWAEVSKRDWTVNKIGHGLPEEES